MAESAAAIYQPGKEGIGRIVIDVPDKGVNVLSRSVLQDIASAVDAAEAAAPVRLEIVSGKAGSFVAGADIFELQALSRVDLDAYLKFGQELFDRIARLPMSTIAVIEGACLGGGLELAMACDTRIARPSPKPAIGLPETTLGLLPGWGGTIRLPRLVGAAKAAELITSGKSLTPAQAYELGLVDAIIEGDTAPVEATLNRKGASAADLDSLKFPQNPPAPSRAVTVLRTGIEQGHQAGLDAERQALGDLRDSNAGQNLIRLFVLKQSAKKRAIKAARGEARTVEHVAVCGGGTMGAGIAQALLAAGLNVSIIEADAERAEAAWKRLGDLFRIEIEKGRLPAEKASKMLDRAGIGSAADAPRLVENADLVIEAVSENMAAKTQLFLEIGRRSKQHAILATNTSSLSVAELGRASTHSKRVVGLHFFNPVSRMPLVEVVRAPDSSDNAVASAVAVALTAGKTPIVVNDAPGFAVNRVLMPYLSEAMRCVADGISVDAIDAAAMEWGMPMGPLALIDTIGFDVTLGIFDAMHPHCGERVQALPGLREAVARGRLGRKSGRGFYHYEGGKPQRDEHVASVFHAAVTPADTDDLQDRLLLPMVNEAARVLEEGVVESADDLDLATILGLGVAGWRGGIARYADDEGTINIARRLQKLADRHGPRFAPSALIQKSADENSPLASYAKGAS